jgi:FkbM family methyltransferase
LSIKKIANRAKKHFFPSSHRVNMKRWKADCGDRELRYNYDLNEDSIVFDMGGYEGQWASDIFARYRCNILIFEPVSNFAEQINKRFCKNDKIKVFQYGLGAYSRNEKIHLSANGSSIFGTSLNCEEIRVVDVKEWMDNGSVEKIDLIKINIEGGEYELLSRLIETGLIDKINNIQVQFHEVTSTSLSEMHIIQQSLSKTHKPTYQYEFVWENWVRR